MLPPISRAIHVRTSRPAVKQQANQRRGALPADEALALAHLRRYTCERRQALSGRTTTNVDPRNQPGRNSNRANRWDDRLIRCIDFARALSELDPLESVILQLVYCDGETLEAAGRATGRSARHIQDRLPIARRALVVALEERNLL